MKQKVKYTCSHCGKGHEEWPALAYLSPTGYNSLSDHDKQTIARLDTDFCVIEYPDQTDRFIRCTMVQKVIDHCKVLEYGLWVSLSDKSFQDYLDNYNNENHETTYFGWLCNDLPEYDFSGGSIPTTVFTQTGNQRPYIVPHQDFNHPLVSDYYKGITKAETERRIKAMLALTNAQAVAPHKKPWWKLWYFLYL